ncbi:hypothetical protein D9M71_792340 [compost metagenome]
MPLSLGQIQGGQPAFPLGLVVLVVFLASASATSAVMPKTANVLMVISGRLAGAHSVSRYAAMNCVAASALMAFP